MKYKCITHLEEVFKKHSFLSSQQNRLEANWSELNALKLKIEDFSEVICSSNWIISGLTQIDTLISQGQYTGDLNILSTIVADLLFFASCVPSQYSGFGKNRRAIEVVSHNQLIRILNSIVESKNLEETHYFNYLSKTDYNNSNLIQRTFLLSLCHLCEETKSSLLNNTLFEDLLKHEKIAKWCLGASGGLQQNYLNTCLAVTYAQDVLTQSNNILSLNEVLKTIHQHINKRLDNIISNGDAEALNRESFSNGPSIYDECNRRLEKSLHEINAIENSINELTQRTRTPRLKLRRLKLQWNKTFQRLLSMANIFESNWADNEKNFITINSKQLVLGSWNFSCWLTGIFCLVKICIPMFYKPGIRDRIHKGYISDEGSEQLLRNIIQITAAHESTEYILQTCSTKIKRNLFRLKPKDFNQVLKNLWVAIAQSGGAQMARDRHGLFIKSVIHKNQKKFLIADPLSPRLKIWSFGRIARFLQLEDYEMYLDTSHKEQSEFFEELATAINPL